MTGSKNVALLRPPWAADPSGQALALDKARVIEIEQDGVLVLTSVGLALKGQKAAGCLLEPGPGDTVLLYRDPQEGAFILSVLVRADAPGRIAIKGDVTLESEGGVLRLGGQTVELSGRESASVEAPLVNVRGVSGQAVFHGLSLAADRLQARTRTLSVVAQTIETLAERMIQRLKDCFRRVDRMDETRAGHVNLQARDRLSVKAGDASIVAEHDVKVDGATIRLG